MMLAGKNSATEPTKSDRRIVRTLNALTQALIQLSLEHGYDVISIRDITERAKVGYATFFRHFSDKEALLNAVLDAFISELTERLSSQPEDSDLAKQGEFIFGYIQEYDSLSRLLLASRSRAQVMKAIQQNRSHQLFPENPNSSVPSQIANYHWMSATFSLIEWWLEHDMIYPPQRMGEIYRDLIALPTRKVIFGESAEEMPATDFYSEA